MSYAHGSSGSPRRMIVAGILATIIVSSFAWVGIAYGAAGGNMVLGANNSAGATETLLHSTVSGDKATLALFNDNNTASSPRNDALRVFLTAVGGAGVSVFAGPGTFSTTSVADTGVRSRATGIAVQADAVGAGAQALVTNGSSTLNGSTAVNGSTTLNGSTAMNGAVTFSSAGLATIAAGKKRVTVSSPVALTGSSKVLVTIQSKGGTLKFVLLHTASGSFTITLASKATSTVAAAWFVIS